jgi:hypothetical protein
MCLPASILDEVDVAGGTVGADVAVAKKVVFSNLLKTVKLITFIFRTLANFFLETLTFKKIS